MTKLFVALCACVLALASCGGGSSPKDVALKSTEYAFSGNFDSYVELLNVDDEKRQEIKLLLAQKGRQLLREVEKNGGVETITADEGTLSEDGTKCSVNVTVTFKNASEENQTVKLEKVDGKWLLPDPMGNK